MGRVAIISLNHLSISMSKIYSHFQPHREWELFEREEITHISFEKGYYKLPKECIIHIRRDSQFDLKATISGVINDSKLLDSEVGEKSGTVSEHESIYGYSKEGLIKYKIHGIVIGKYTSHLLSLDPPSISFEADLLLDSIEKFYYEPDKKSESIQDWFLSSNTDISFSRTTQRKEERHFQKARLEIDLEETTYISKGSGSSRDFLFVNTPSFNFIVAKVPEAFGPDWSFNLCIEYRNGFIRLPDEEERVAVKEFVSFIFGTQLLHIGSTYYGTSCEMISQDMKNPWGDNVVSKCNQGSLPPTDISKHHKNQAEIILNSLLPEYLKLRKRLKLSSVIWKYWIARYSSIGTNLPILSSAIETLAEFVLKEHKEVKHYYIEHKEFQKFIESELNSIDEKLSGKPFKEKILNKIRSSAQRGSNEKVEMMFEIIVLKVDEVEREAMKARNKMAHSSFGKIDREEAIKLIRLTRAYETLFHRVFLKILGYNGEYIDYYTLTHPTRNINEAIPKSK